MMSKIKVSIILATYNWPAALDIILANLLSQVEIDPSLELVIADDGSAHPTTKLVKKYLALNSRIHHVWHEDDGFRKSIILNKAVAAAKGEYLLFIDGDCIPFPDYVSEHLKLREPGYLVAGNRVLLSKSYTQELLVKPKLINKLFKLNFLQWLLLKLGKKANKALPGFRLGNGKWRYSRSRNWKYPKGCNFAVAKQDFIAINGFDEAFTGWGHEDADLFVRFLHNGVRIKDGRFAVPVLHLWHKNEDRNNEPENSARLMERVNNPEFKIAESGISQYLSS